MFLIIFLNGIRKQALDYIKTIKYIFKIRKKKMKKTRKKKTILRIKNFIFSIKSLFLDYVMKVIFSRVILTDIYIKLKKFFW